MKLASPIAPWQLPKVLIPRDVRRWRLRMASNHVTSPSCLTLLRLSALPIARMWSWSRFSCLFSVFVPHQAFTPHLLGFEYIKPCRDILYIPPICLISDLLSFFLFLFTFCNPRWLILLRKVRRSPVTLLRLETVLWASSRTGLRSQLPGPLRGPGALDRVAPGGRWRSRPTSLGRTIVYAGRISSARPQAPSVRCAETGRRRFGRPSRSRISSFKRSGITGLTKSPGKPVPSPRQRPGSRYPRSRLLLCWTARTRLGLRPRPGRRRRYAGHPVRPVHIRRKRGSTLPLLLMNPLLPACPPGRRQTEDVDIGLRSLGTVTTLDTVRGGLEVGTVGLRPPSLRRQHEHQGRVSPLMARRWSSCCTKPLPGSLLQRLHYQHFLIPARDQLRRRHPRQPQ